jgi:hypothetical protein
MLKLLLAAALLAPLALRGPCDLKTSEKKAWCGTCAAFVPRADVKAGACPKDKARVDVVDVCVKPIFIAKCHPTTQGLKPVSCCGTTYDKPTEDFAKIHWVCTTCKEKGPNRDALKHLEACADKKAVKTCEKSGSVPHVSFGK